MMSEALEKLRKITANLPPFQFERQNEGHIAFFPARSQLAFRLLEKKEILVTKIFFSKETLIPKHHHQAREISIVYEGKIGLRKKNETKELLSGAYFVVNPGEPHSVLIKEDTWLLSITTPREEGYPNASKQLG